LVKANKDKAHTPASPLPYTLAVTQRGLIGLNACGLTHIANCTSPLGGGTRVVRGEQTCPNDCVVQSGGGGVSLY
jgi:hypothetical protein